MRELRRGFGPVVLSGNTKAKNGTTNASIPAG
jgi:hypothetical protein